MRIAVCDDEQRFRDDIRNHISALYKSLDVIVDSFSDGRELLTRFQTYPYQLVFLDIEMPAMDGITVAKKLREMDPNVYIVFLTGHVEYALEGYEVNALRYLTKPVQEEKLLEVLRYVDKSFESKKQIRFRTDREEYLVSLDELQYIEAQNQYILIHTTNGDYLVRSSMGEYEEVLKGYGFFRVHRGYLVSLGQIKKVGKAECVLNGGITIPVSRSSVKPLKEALYRYLEEEAF
ncbi:MAG: response regulator transcription factor [Lachnospiraceae bacterium]|nr:response regulator transcription factor [Lachnospiraceae bacterium]